MIIHLSVSPMRMSSKTAAKGSKPGTQDSNSGSEIESENQLNQGDNDDSHHNVHETDLFSFLSAMHLSGGSISSSSIIGNQIHPAAAQVLASRKRKFLDQASLGSGNGSGKLFGAMRPPSQRGNSDEEAPLHTPQCSQSGLFIAVFFA